MDLELNIVDGVTKEMDYNRDMIVRENSKLFYRSIEKKNCIVLRDPPKFQSRPTFGNLRCIE